jgi:DNA-binding transcriptional LysR family regulator
MLINQALWKSLFYYLQHCGQVRRHRSVCWRRGSRERHGEPAHPDELHEHIGLQYSNTKYKQQWRYQSQEGKTIYAQPQIRIRANNGEALAAAACAGPEITRGPTFILGSYIRKGSLITILNEYQRATVGYYAAYPQQAIYNDEKEMRWALV